MKNSFLISQFSEIKKSILRKELLYRYVNKIE
jgi:hypothetical protein